LTLSDRERRRYKKRLTGLNGRATIAQVRDRTICQDVSEVLGWLPGNSVDLVFADPPYNLGKSFNKAPFTRRTAAAYEEWLESWIAGLPRIMKRAGSFYLCADWRSTAAAQRVIERHFRVRSRITWEHEKGRGSARNWKNCAEDIWFCTISDKYTFNVDDVKLKRRVIAPYTDEDGKPKGWKDDKGSRYRLTFPSNVWTDLTVPFWSMPENTDHPTQKPEKLLAKIILASSREGEVVFDPFLGSGTTSVVAKKLKRHYIGVEADETFCCLAEKRLELVASDPSIQGYSDGVFWERNTRRRPETKDQRPKTECKGKG